MYKSIKQLHFFLLKKLNFVFLSNRSNFHIFKLKGLKFQIFLLKDTTLIILFLKLKKKNHNYACSIISI